MSNYCSYIDCYTQVPHDHRTTTFGVVETSDTALVNARAKLDAMTKRAEAAEKEFDRLNHALAEAIVTKKEHDEAQARAKAADASALFWQRVWEARITRLEAALREIAEWPEGGVSSFDGNRSITSQDLSMRDFARRALSTEVEE